MKVIRTLFLALVASAVFLTLTIGLAPLFIPLILLFGWIFSASRLLGALHPNAASLFLFLAAAIVLIAGTDAFLRWLFRCIAPSPIRAPALCWRLKWTICGYGILFCALVAIGSLVLTTHQFFWLSKSTESWFVDVTRPQISLIMTAGSLYNAAETNEWNTARTQQVFLGMNSLRESCPLLELFEPIWIENDKATLSAILLLPRRTASRSMTRFAVLEPGSHYRTEEISAFQQILKSYNHAKISAPASHPVPP